MTVMCCYLESGFLVVSRMFGVYMSESSYDWRVLRSRVDSLWFLECLVWI